MVIGDFLQGFNRRSWDEKELKFLTKEILSTATEFYRFDFQAFQRVYTLQTEDIFTGSRFVDEKTRLLSFQVPNLFGEGRHFYYPASGEPLFFPFSSEFWVPAPSDPFV